jgi:hypothetical protein
VADNVTTNPGSGGAVFASDEIAGVQWPFVKNAFGPRDTATEVADVDGQRFPVRFDPEQMADLTLLLGMILEKLPRVDGNDRVVVNTSDQGNVTVALAAAQTLATLTTLTTLTTMVTANDLNRLNAMGATAATSRPTDAMPLHAANQGAQHLYSNIVVAP